MRLENKPQDGASSVSRSQITKRAEQAAISIPEAEEEAEDELELELFALDRGDASVRASSSSISGSPVEDEAVRNLSEGCGATNRVPCNCPNPALRRFLLRRKLFRAIGCVGPLIGPLLILAALALLLLLPSPVLPFSKRTYVDENALQPGAANVHWGWAQVGLCDAISKEVANVQRLGPQARSSFLFDKLIYFGLRPMTQAYTFRLADGRNVSGINTYARWFSGRSDGREAVIVAASWLSRWKGEEDPDEPLDEANRTEIRRTNVRGISINLGLAKFLTAQMHWSKDIIFVFSDGYMDGMQAWSNAYFGHRQSNLEAESVDCAGAVVWNAIAVDYPSDSFSDLVILHEGKDGQLPNMDALNTLVKISEDVGRVPSRLPGSEEIFRAGRDDETGGGWGWLGRFVETKLGWGLRGVTRYRKGALNLMHQMKSQIVGHPTGLHGLFQRFHVDAVTVFAVPAKGPHGFYDLGRILESQVVSYSNLIERLHHSQFFYLLTSPTTFIQLGIYLPVALLLSVALTLAGLSKWLKEGRLAQDRRRGFVEMYRCQQGKLMYAEDPQLDNPTVLDLRMDLAILHIKTMQQAISDTEGAQPDYQSRLAGALHSLDVQGRPLKRALTLMLCCHAPAITAAALGGLSKPKSAWLLNVAVLLQALVLMADRYINTAWTSFAPWLRSHSMSLAHLLHAYTMLHAGMGIAVLSLLNFSAATAIAVILTPPLYLLPLPSQNRSLRIAMDAGDGGIIEADRIAYQVPWDSCPTVLAQIRAGLAGLLLVGLLPWNLYWAAKAITRLAASDFGATLPTASASILSLLGVDATSVEAAVDAALFDYEVLQTSFIPVLSLFYVPLVLEAICACFIAASR